MGRVHSKHARTPYPVRRRDEAVHIAEWFALAHLQFASASCRHRYIVWTQTESPAELSAPGPRAQREEHGFCEMGAHRSGYLKSRAEHLGQKQKTTWQQEHERPPPEPARPTLERTADERCNKLGGKGLQRTTRKVCGRADAVCIADQIYLVVCRTGADLTEVRATHLCVSTL